MGSNVFPRDNNFHNFYFKENLNLKPSLSLTLGFLIILAPRILFELRHGFLMIHSFIDFLFTKTTEDNLDLYHFLQNRYYIHLDELGKTLIHNDLVSILFLIFIIGSIFYFYKKNRDLIKNFMLTSVIILLTFYVVTLIFSHAIWPHYLIGLPVLYIFIFTLCIYSVQEKLKNKFSFRLLFLFWRL